MLVPALFPVAVQFCFENYSFIIENNFLSCFAITPGRKVDFAAAEESPIEFKSSIIRFCIYESKAFKKRLVVGEVFVSLSRLKYNGKIQWYFLDVVISLKERRKSRE